MAPVKTVLVAGATGLVGSALCERLALAGYSIIGLTRYPRNGIGPLRYAAWSPVDPESAASVLVQEMEKAFAVVNLAGEPLAAGRWNEDKKGEIHDSRVLSTRALVRAIERASERPRVLINASAVGYYGAQGDAELDESGAPGAGFLAGVCRDWEAEAEKAQIHGVRVARIRIGVVMAREGGALKRMLPPFRCGLGGPLGSGRQWMSWIHIDDLTEMIRWSVEAPEVAGILNAVAPSAVTNRVFSETLARVLGRPCFFRVPAVLLRAAMGEMADILLQGQKVLPRRAINGGFSFRFPDLESALRDLLKPGLAK